MSHNVEIQTNGNRASVFIDGQEAKGITAYSVTHAAGELPVVTLEVKAAALTIDGDQMLAPLPEPWARFYQEKSPDNGAVRKFAAIAENNFSESEGINPECDSKPQSVYIIADNAIKKALIRAEKDMNEALRETPKAERRLEIMNLVMRRSSKG